VNSVLWGLLGALLVGASDCIARVTTQRVSVSVLFLAIMGLSLSVLTTHHLLVGEWPPWHAQAWMASALSGLSNLLALFFLYRALARGPVAVASPAASTFTVMLVGLNILSGEAWSWWQILAMVVVFVAVGMLARPTAADQQTAADNSNTHNLQSSYSASWLRTTALFGLAAAATVSLRMYLAQEAGAAIGPMHALYLNRLFALLGAIVLITYLLIQRHSLMWPRGQILRLVGLQALLETAALGAFLIGSANGGRVAATIGFAAFAAATTLFARIWLGEKIGWQRSFWIGVVGAGVLIGSLAEPSS